MQTTYKYWTILDLSYCIYQFDNREDAEEFEELAENRYDQWGTHFGIKEYNLEDSKNFLRQQCGEQEYFEHMYKHK